MTDTDKIIADAVWFANVIESLKLPKGTRIRGTKHGTEIHRKDGLSYLITQVPND